MYHSTEQKYSTQSVRSIFTIGFIALIIGHLMINTFVPNEMLNFGGLLLTSLFIFFFTLRKNDVFSFVMVMYFASTFPFLLAKGGAFNMVSVVCTLLFMMMYQKFPGEKRIGDKWFYIFIVIWVLSSILGWIFHYTGQGLDYIYSISTFFGAIFMLLMASRLIITHERIKVFLKLNLVIIIYATIASINKYVNIIQINSPLMPTYGDVDDYFEGGGLIGTSPLYGEHSLILLMLFVTFYIFSDRRVFNKTSLIIGSIIAFVNIFMSISRSVFLLSLLGLLLIYLIQFRLSRAVLINILQPILIIFFIIFSVYSIVRVTGLDYVFDRIVDYQEINLPSSGISIESVKDGTVFNRVAAFAIAKERYESKESWFIGYGWGLDKNNRDAYYVDPSIKRGSAHSQIFAILFLFGWLGFIAYWGYILRLIYKSFRLISNQKIDYTLRVFMFFFMIAFILFILNEIKADSVSIPTYFTVTLIWMGLGTSVLTHDPYQNANNRRIYS
jgi:hypothetical protein